MCVTAKPYTHSFLLLSRTAKRNTQKIYYYKANKFAYLKLLSLSFELDAECRPQSHCSRVEATAAVAIAIRRLVQFIPWQSAGGYINGVVAKWPSP